MATVHFVAEIGEDQVIHLPAGIRVAPGKAEVTVVEATDTVSQSREESGIPSGVPEVAMDLACFAHELDPVGLPSDLAINHDHYLHGAARGANRP